MISNARILEKKRYMRESQSTRFAGCDYFYPFSRQGLYVYLKNESYRTVLLPSYVAEGVFDPFRKLGYDIKFYDVNEDGYISSTIFEKRIDVFVYIHYFGLYNAANLKLIKENREKFTFFIEDFSHIVYHEQLELSGDIGLFSFTKIFGITEGSCIKFNIPHKKKAVYVEKQPETRQLRKSLFWVKVLESYCQHIKINGWLTKCLKWMGIKDYYSLLMASYWNNYPRLSSTVFQTLSRLDFDAIVRVRKHYAKLYLENLRPELLLNIPKMYYMRQALFAFPIKVCNRDMFVKMLKKGGVFALTLTNRWWFGNQGNKAIYNSHLLLPINHYLREQEIKTVIRQVNEVFVKIEQNE